MAKAQVCKKIDPDLFVYLNIEIAKFKFDWFKDCGHWFIYIHLGSKWCRFSDCGFIKGGN